MRRVDERKVGCDSAMLRVLVDYAGGLGIFVYNIHVDPTNRTHYAFTASAAAAATHTNIYIDETLVDI